ncbi:MAG: glycosyltransferase family 2 protein [Candidatus Nanopelagicales bacterium]
MGVDSTTSVVVAVPALNESETLADVLGGIRRAVPEAVLLVIDDGSSDTTAEVARNAGAVTLQMPFNVGVGGAMRVAFLYAFNNGYESLVQVDADGQHDPGSIRDLLAALDGASVAVGSRFVDARSRQWVGWSRRVVMRVLAALLSRVTGTQLDDVTSGFRAADREAIELFAQHYPSEYLGDTVESLVLSARAGLRIVQVPAVMHPRQGGRPSHGVIRSSLFLGRALLALSVAVTRGTAQNR